MSDQTLCPLCDTQPRVTGKQDGEWVVGATAYCDCTRVTAYHDGKTLKVPRALAEDAQEKWHEALRIKQKSNSVQTLFEQFDLEPA
jgi:predicted RNase H-like HicB family nuclease